MFSLTHTHTDTVLLLAAPVDIQICLFWTQKKAEELRRGVGKGLRIAPDVRIYQQAGGIRQSVWKGFLKCTHTISITLTSNNLQKFCIHLKKKGKHERDSSFRAQSVWQRYKRKKLSTILGCILSVGDVENLAVGLCLCNSLFGWTSVQFYSELLKSISMCEEMVLSKGINEYSASEHDW